MRLNKVILLLMAVCAAGMLTGGDTFLLKNHDFRYWGGSRYPLANWRCAIGCPEVNLEFSVPLDRGEVPREALIINKTPTTAMWYQAVALPAGKYHFSIEMRSDDRMTGFVSVAGANVAMEAGTEWTTLSGEFELEEDRTATFHFGSSTAGTIAFRNFDVEIVNIKSAPAVCADGRQIGRIELPANASDAEKFAAYELQRILKQLCGAAPGVSGRDAVAEGVAIKIGGAADAAWLGQLRAKGPDSFAVAFDDGGDLNLTGNNDRGTLYAVYDFLALQGCGWITPGAIGETVPTGRKIVLPDTGRVSSPAFNVRGFMFYFMQFRSDGGWEFYSYDDIFDWALRNRFNAIWAAEDRTLDMRPHRGGSIRQTLNHSWYKFLRDDRPEWFPLVDGKRLKNHTSGRPNQLCVSNPALREHVADYIVEFFAANPDCRTFGLSPEDEPCYWCECGECRKLDADEGRGEWRKDSFGRPIPAFMTDRTIDFVSDIARRVAERCPGKMIECYSYSSTMAPPARTQVADNLIIRYCHWAETAYWDRPLLSEANDRDRWGNKISDCLNGWRKMGAGELGLYDYDNYLYPDAVFPQVTYTVEALESFNRNFGVTNYMPESSSQIWSNPLLYGLRAEALWGGGNGDFARRKAGICERYFGPAAPAMNAYYELLEAAVSAGEYELKSGRRAVKDKTAVYIAGLTLADLERAETLLDEATLPARDDARLLARLNWVRFAHQITVMAVVSNLAAAGLDDLDAAEAAFHSASRLAKENDIFFTAMGCRMLRDFYRVPVIRKSHFTLPLRWKLVPDGAGELEKRGIPLPEDLDWREVSVERDWTAQGVDYHGTAWYQVEFTLPEGVTAAGLKLYFGAIDGTAEIYLDGVRLGGQDKDAGLMWDKPFTIAIPDDFPARAPHILTVKVTKLNQAAGIWRKVELIELEER